MILEIIKVNNQSTAEQKEVVLNHDYISKEWTMAATIPKYFRKGLKQGWIPIKKYVYDDGTVCGMVLRAPERAVTIRNVEKKKMSEKQRKNLSEED